MIPWWIALITALVGACFGAYTRRVFQVVFYGDRVDEVQGPYTMYGRPFYMVPLSLWETHVDE